MSPDKAIAFVRKGMNGLQKWFPFIGKVGLFSQKRLFFTDLIVLGLCLVIPGGILVLLAYCFLRMWVIR
jgi:hypothetical protein